MEIPAYRRTKVVTHSAQEAKGKEPPTLGRKK